MKKHLYLCQKHMEFLKPLLYVCFVRVQWIFQIFRSIKLSLWNWVLSSHRISLKVQFKSYIHIIKSGHKEVTVVCFIFQQLLNGSGLPKPLPSNHRNKSKILFIVFLFKMLQFIFPVYEVSFDCHNNYCIHNNIIISNMFAMVDVLLIRWPQSHKKIKYVTFMTLLYVLC